MTIDNKTVTVYDNASFSGQAIRIEKIVSGFQFTEGPVWHPEGYLLFSDIPANCIWQLFPDGRKKNIFGKQRVLRRRQIRIIGPDWI